MIISQGYRQMPPSYYLYVDGNCLRREVDKYLSQFRDESVRDYALQIPRPGVSIAKTFFYDALPVKLEDQSEEDFKSRLAEREAEFNRLSKDHATHVRIGSSRASKRNKRSVLTQKGVDVQLTVDALRDAYGGVTRHMWFLLGDADFLPLIDQLVAIGIQVTVWHPKIVNDELIMAADQAIPLRADTLMTAIGVAANNQEYIPVTVPTDAIRWMQTPFSWHDEMFGDCKIGINDERSWVLTIEASPDGALAWLCHDHRMMEGVLTEQRVRVPQGVRKGLKALQSQFHTGD